MHPHGRPCGACEQRCHACFYECSVQLLRRSLLALLVCARPRGEKVRLVPHGEVRAQHGDLERGSVGLVRHHQVRLARLPEVPAPSVSVGRHSGARGRRGAHWTNGASWCGSATNAGTMNTSGVRSSGRSAASAAARHTVSCHPHCTRRASTWRRSGLAGRGTVTRIRRLSPASCAESARARKRQATHPSVAGSRASNC